MEKKDSYKCALSSDRDFCQENVQYFAPCIHIQNISLRLNISVFLTQLKKIILISNMHFDKVRKTFFYLEGVTDSWILLIISGFFSQDKCSTLVPKLLQSQFAEPYFSAPCYLFSATYVYWRNFEKPRKTKGKKKNHMLFRNVIKCFLLIFFILALIYVYSHIHWFLVHTDCYHHTLKSIYFN